MQTVLSSAEDFVKQGNDALRRKDWPEAVRLWSLMREKFPEHPRGYVSGTAALKENREFSTADALALEGMEKFPKEAGLYMEYGLIAMRQRDWAEALARQGMEQIPHDIEPFISYAEVAMRQRNFTEALNRWALVREKFPQFHQGDTRACAACLELLDWDQAEALARQGMERVPHDIQPFISWADIAMRQRSFTEALNRWALVWEKFPRHPRGLLAKAATLKVKGEFDAADAVLLSGMEEFPGDVQLFWNDYVNVPMGWIGWSESVKRCVSMREKFSNEPRCYLTCITAFNHMKDFSAAESVAYEGIKRFPSNIEFHKSYANTAIMQERWHEASKRSTIIQEKFPYHTHGYLLGAAAFRGMGEYGAAEDILLQGMARCPAEESLYVAHAYLAMCRKEYDEAFKRWAVVREKFREFPLADFHLETTTRCKVSTIILSYNHEAHIACAIESALRQVGDFEHEIIVSDDGSTDNTRQIIAEYCKRYPNIINISEEKNVGNPENYKRCIAAASGDYIAILEGDDFWIDPYKLYIQINTIQNNNCCIVCTGKYHINDKNYFIGKYSKVINKIINSKIQDQNIILKENIIFNFSHWMVEAKLIKNTPINNFCVYKDNKKYFVSELMIAIQLTNYYNKTLYFINDILSIRLILYNSTYNKLNDFQKITEGYNMRKSCLAFARKNQYDILDRDVYKFQKILQKNAITH